VETNKTGMDAIQDREVEAAERKSLTRNKLISR
jgi:hypothetical protein